MVSLACVFDPLYKAYFDLKNSMLTPPFSPKANRIVRIFSVQKLHRLDWFSNGSSTMLSL